MPSPLPVGIEVTTYRVLSLDGGGIYGLTTAFWLRMLCEADEHFLSKEDVQNEESPIVFAGLSAGAVMALLLAQAESPREAILRGDLENIWLEPVGAFSNQLNPITAWRSLFTLGGWAGEQDFMSLLYSYFGTQTMKDLVHPVFVSAFNWTGEKSPKFPDPNEFVSGWFPFWPWWAAPFSPSWGKSNNPTPWPSAFSPDNIVKARQKIWGPKFFTSHDKDQVSKDLPVVEIAYGCCTAPGTRATRGGIGDAAVFTPNPSANVLAGLYHFVSFAHGRTMNPGDVLNSIHLLSVGNGFATPHYWLRNTDLSYRQTSHSPTNPLAGIFFSPTSSAMFDGNIENANILCELFLTVPDAQAHEAQRAEGTEQEGSHPAISRYFRLAPRLLPVPAPTASVLARFSCFKDFFVHQIHHAVMSPKSLAEVAKALKFIRKGKTKGPWVRKIKSLNPGG
jgi:hypothetical protein